MARIKPITALRDTVALSKEMKSFGGPLFITKNGVEDLVLLSNDEYEKLSNGLTGPSNHRKENTICFGKSAATRSSCLGFVRVRACSPFVSIGAVSKNVKEIEKCLKEAEKDKVHLLAFPELSLTGYTCGDLFLNDNILQATLVGLKHLKEISILYPHVLFVVGGPLQISNSLYNCAFAFHNGKYLGAVPKMNIPNYSEFYEKRYFDSWDKETILLDFGIGEAPFGNGLIFVDDNYPDLKIGIEICEDLWVPNPPSTTLALGGATVLINLSASNEIVGKKEYRRQLVSSASSRLISAYVYADAGQGESTTDLVFAGHNLIAENGKILQENDLFDGKSVTADIDLEKLVSERRKMTTFTNSGDLSSSHFLLPLEEPVNILRHYAKNPFIPEGDEVDTSRVSLIIKMQAKGLEGRLRAIHCQKVVVGISGGLDSTLALLVAVEAFKNLGYPLKNIYSITLPAFGTSQRTHDNAKELSDALGVSFQEIKIGDSLLSHFKDINHSKDDHNVTFENAQARMRTMVLLDFANDIGGIMVGTGDLSELCLGWTTFNGDHMSNYGVNASIPKTLVRYLCKGYAILQPQVSKSLLDIIDTPISPELLPVGKDGKIAQKTEDKIGPYELHDFFIYHYLRFGYQPRKIFVIAKQAYLGVYDDVTIKKWLREFFRRFFSNQFKRSTLPDGAKVGSVAISPRGDLRMPSDADASDYLFEVDSIKV